MEHDPVLVDRVVEFLSPPLHEGGVFVDATVGRGGHGSALLEAAPRAHLLGIDRDPVALEASRSNLSTYKDRVRLVRDQFKNLASVLERLGIEKVRGVLLDLGVSSPQLDEHTRGFSYRHEGPLDMRMDPSQPLSASVVVNEYSVGELERVVRVYGEERFARRIARAVVDRRPVRSTTELAEIVKEAIPAPARRTGPHPARRTFQAIRIEVNDELASLEHVLPASIDALEPGGRLAVVSYHSLEDRIVKRFLRDETKGCICPPDFPVCRCDAKVRVRVLTPKPVRPPQEEVERNPRARAAKLRVAERSELEIPA
ncbi:MAG: 16S rRNA (cytosine(1402)-N(4))-methyltransferase RsmH [Actinomycetota bacterium]|nr:16S rRNA (cytosine(1402)-N(4))-methyltransferase RsmH [Actinomycetota bacterium]